MIAMHLSWQPSFSLSRKPVKRSIARKANRGFPSNVQGSHQFEFVAERPWRIRGTKRIPPEQTTGYETGSEGIDSAFDMRNQPGNQSSIGQTTGFQTGSPVDAPVDTHPNDDDEADDQEILSGPPRILQHSWRRRDRRIFQSSDICAGDRHVPTVRNKEANHDERHEPADRYACGNPDSMVLWRLPRTERPTPVLIPNTILYGNLIQRFTPILDRYNKEFCKIPLTNDLKINPFQYHADHALEPSFLSHAVMALAGHHVDSTSTQHHRIAALRLLRESISTNHNAQDRFTMLDTILILFSLDETRSTLGNWNTHLVGAYSVLEACGSIERWRSSARANAQVGILTWWDAITSLLSREPCVFPYAYFDAAISDYDGRRWDYFGLCGCPLSLVKIVMRLARLSAEKQKIPPMEFATVGVAAVLELEQALTSWHHTPPKSSFQDEESMQQDQDRMHCSEAWRNGLLLYLFRVFHWEPGSTVPMHILYKARAVVDHVAACRDEKMVGKQALLPLFFAGCELQDRSVRKRIVEFCAVWSERTRYHMFRSTIPLLEEIWTEQKRQGFENVWWAQIVDKYHTSEHGHPLQMRLCFG